MNFACNKDETVQTFHVIKTHYCNGYTPFTQSGCCLPGSQTSQPMTSLQAVVHSWHAVEHNYINIFLLSHVWTCSKCLRSPTPRVAEATRFSLVYGGSVKGNNNKAIASMLFNE